MSLWFRFVSVVVGVFLIVGAVFIGVWALVTQIDWECKTIFGYRPPKIVNNKIDVLCPGQSVKVLIGGDGKMTIVEPRP